jgi:abortive infection bacteriophage resistance protein
MKFDKPAIDADAQIALLRSRGLLIPDEARAKHYLRFIGYYRLAGYSLPLQIDYNADGSHRFLDGVSFDDVLDLNDRSAAEGCVTRHPLGRPVGGTAG